MSSAWSGFLGFTQSRHFPSGEITLSRNFRMWSSETKVDQYPGVTVYRVPSSSNSQRSRKVQTSLAPPLWPGAPRTLFHSLSAHRAKTCFQCLLTIRPRNRRLTSASTSPTIEIVNSGVTFRPAKIPPTNNRAPRTAPQFVSTIEVGSRKGMGLMRQLLVSEELSAGFVINHPPLSIFLEQHTVCA